MRQNSILLAAFILTSIICIGQTNNTYEVTESRFLKTDLNNIDSSAFEELGMNKVNELLEYSQLHQQPTTYNTVHNPFIFKKADELFLENDSIPTEMVLNKIALIKNESKEPTSLINVEDGAFNNIVIGSGSRTCSLHLLLVKIPKQFGKEEKLIWQVFLSKPSFSF